MSKVLIDDGSYEQRLRKVPHSGILLASLSAVIASCATFTVKLLPGIHSVEIVVIRSIIQLLVALVVIVVSQSPISGKGERWPLFVRSFCGFIAYSACYMAFQLIPLGDAAAIVFSAPVYVSLFACLLLGEAFGISQLVLMCITLSGVVLISKPTFVFSSKAGDITYPPEGYLLAFLASICMTMTYVSMRKLQKTPSSVVLAWFSLLSVIFGLVYLGVLHFALGKTIKWPGDFSSHEWLYLACNGICGAVSQLCVTLALKLEEAGLVSLTRCSDIVLAYVFQVFFLAEKIQWTSILGAVVVVVGVSLTCIRRVIAQRKAQSEKEAKSKMAALNA